MATFSLRRFSHSEVLRRVSPEHMRRLLKPYGDYLGQRGYPLPESPDTALEYSMLARIFASPDSDTPPELAEALYLIDEMATPEGMDALLDAANSARLDLDLKSDPTPEEVALQIYLASSALLRRHHAQHYWTPHGPSNRFSPVRPTRLRPSRRPTRRP